MSSPLHWMVEPTFDQWQIEQLKAIPHGYVQCVGDSNTGQLLARSIARRIAITTAFGSGSTPQALANIGQILNASWPPDLVFFWLGTNTALPNLTAAQRDTFVSEYIQLIQHYQSTGCKVLIGSVLPIEPNKSLSTLRSQSSVNALNSDIVYRVLPACSLTVSENLVNFNYLFLQNGIPKTGWTRDGIHPNAQSMLQVYTSINASANALV